MIRTVLALALVAVLVAPARSPDAPTPLPPAPSRAPAAVPPLLELAPDVSPTPEVSGGDLVGALVRSAPHVTPAQAVDHVAAARRAARPAGRYTITAEVLLSVAWTESRYVETGVSRLECDVDDCRRVRGNWPAPFPARFRSPYFCGYLGGKARTEAACRELGADTARAYVEAADHLAGWFRFCAGDALARTHADRWRCALAGYNGGIRAARAGSTSYAVQVIYRARRLAAGWPPPRLPRVAS